MVYVDGGVSLVHFGSSLVVSYDNIPYRIKCQHTLEPLVSHRCKEFSLKQNVPPPSYSSTMTQDSGFYLVNLNSAIQLFHSHLV